MTELLFEGPAGLRLQKKYLEALVANKCFQFTTTFFPYTSGEIGPYFVNTENIIRDGVAYHKVCRDLANGIELRGDIRANIDGISGGESRDWVFSYPTAANLKLPHFTIYKDGKTFGFNVAGFWLAHIADLNNEGSSMRDKWWPSVRKQSGVIRDAVFFVDRMEDGVEVMEELDINSYALVRLDDSAWDHLKDVSGASQVAYQNLMERGRIKQERDFWAEKMLRSEDGKFRLVDLFNDDKTREKVRGILVKGYPHMKEELLETLRQRSTAGINVDEWLARV